MNLELTEQAEKAYLCWSHYQDEMVSQKYRSATHQKIVERHEEKWREHFLAVTEYMIPQIMEAAGATLIDGKINF